MAHSAIVEFQTNLLNAAKSESDEIKNNVSDISAAALGDKKLFFLSENNFRKVYLVDPFKYCATW